MAAPVKVGKMPAGEKEPVSVKRQVAVLKRLWKYLYRFKWTLMLATFLAIASNLLALVGPSLSGEAIDAIAPKDGSGVDFEKVFLFCTLMIIFYIVSALFGYILNIIMIRLGKKVSMEMRKDLFDHFTKLPVGFFDKHQIGDLINRISYDIDTVNTSLSTDFVQIFSSVITVVGSLTMMIIISPPLVSVFAVTIPISIYFTRYMSKRVRPLFRDRNEKLGELNGYAEEILSGQKTVKAYGREAQMCERFRRNNNRAVESYFKAEYYGSFVGPSMNLINNLSLALVSVLGAVLFFFGKISLGNISAFVLYSRRFSGPINEFANIISELQSATTAAERVFMMIDQAPETPDAADAVELNEVKGLVELKNVKFGYDPDRIIIHNLSFVAKPGSVVAIVGPTGAGKTTIINLLMRFYDVQEGEILLDGHSINQITRKSLRAAYSMVLQDTWLFCGTVRENIAYGRQDATEEEIIEAAKAAKIHSFIEHLPEGYDTVLTDDGTTISKGQKQLLTIARAMLSKAPMLILDEATSNVDSRTERLIQSAMRNLMKGKTCFVIAHRLSTIQNADNILVVKDGDIVEQGNHAELMCRDSFYKSLYNAQFD
ncbi:MAG: ABC transporter ATP-binding protein [Acutalibacteraceae bacterium]|nr:ABC transporter ATP-binding protein [Acutalibacteraceae bacterium]